MQMKRLLAIAFVALGLSATVFAQNVEDWYDYKPAPYMFIGIQGGAQTTFTNYDQLKLITPTASLSFGAFFTPSIGARINANGIWNKGGIEPDFTYQYKYVTTNVDLLVNLITLFGRQDYYPLNVYLIGGIGLNYAWDNDDLTKSSHKLPYAWTDYRFSHNARVGAMLDYNLSKHWSVNLELSANSLSDRYNSKTSTKDDWQVTAQVGLAYKLGYKRKVYTEPVAVAPIEEYVEEKAAETVPVKPVANEKVIQNIQKDIFFEKAKSNIRESEMGKVNEIIQWLKSHPTATASITGHADATGNPKNNVRFASERAQNVAKAIVDAGIDPSRLTVDSKGDTVMPYGNNEKSRVAIVIAQEK